MDVDPDVGQLSGCTSNMGMSEPETLASSPSMSDITRASECTTSSVSSIASCSDGGLSPSNLPAHPTGKRSHPDAADTQRKRPRTCLDQMHPLAGGNFLGSSPPLFQAGISLPHRDGTPDHGFRYGNGNMANGEPTSEVRGHVQTKAMDTTPDRWQPHKHNEAKAKALKSAFKRSSGKGGEARELPGKGVSFAAGVDPEETFATPRHGSFMVPRQEHLGATATPGFHRAQGMLPGRAETRDAVYVDFAKWWRKVNPLADVGGRVGDAGPYPRGHYLSHLLLA